MSMTHISRLLIEIQDIEALRLTCQRCQVSTSYPLAGVSNMEFTCPACSQGFFERGSADRKAFESFISALPALAARTKDAKALLQLELSS